MFLGYAFMSHTAHKMCRMLIADDMGLGKTLQAIAEMNYCQYLVSDLAMGEGWVREHKGIQNFCPIKFPTIGMCSVGFLATMYYRSIPVIFTSYSTL